MKWVVDKIGQVKVWYSADVIEKIKDICIRMPHQALEKILKIIESEDK